MNNDLRLWISQLNWNNSIEVQKQASKKIMENIANKDLCLLLQNEINIKFCWENSTLILKEKILELDEFDDEEIVLGLLGWLQDRTWPGVETVIEILMTIKKEILVKCIEKTVRIALDDDMWLYNIFMCLENFKISQNDFNDTEVYVNLIEAYKRIDT